MALIMGYKLPKNGFLIFYILHYFQTTDTNYLEAGKLSEISSVLLDEVSKVWRC